MDYTPYIPWIVMAATGLVAGWLAGLLLGGGGLIRNLIVGIIGSFVGGALIHAGWIEIPWAFGIPYLDQIIVSTIGAIIVILIARLIGR